MARLDNSTFSRSNSSRTSSTGKLSRRMKNAESVKKYRQKKQVELKEMEQLIIKNEQKIAHLERVAGNLIHELNRRPGKQSTQNTNSGAVYESRPEWFGEPF